MNRSVKIGAFAFQVFLFLSLLPFAFGKASAASAEYRKALERYHAAFGDLYKPGMSSPSITPYFGNERSKIDAYSNLNQAVKELSSIGANMIPFMIEQVRSDLQAIKMGQTSLYDRLDKDVALMIMLGGIQISIDSRDRLVEDSLEYRSNRLRQIEEFLKEWDAGVFDRLEPKFRATRDKSNEEQNTSKLDYRKTFPYLQYGVYALPFLIKEIQANNSAECFNAFLNITFHGGLYESHYKNPMKFYPTIPEKMSFVQEWWNRNKQKFSELRKLSKRIIISLK